MLRGTLQPVFAFPPPAPRVAARVGRRRLTPLLALVVALSAGLAACDDPQPWEDQLAKQATTATTSPRPSTPAPPAAPLARTPVRPAKPKPVPATPAPDATTPSDAPATSQSAGQSRAFAKRVAQDQRAMLALRTMVSAIEGCRSGRASYLDCDTHEELGGSEQLGEALGTGPGQVKITAGVRGFRVTAFSRSGAKFTVARSPSGDRFKCVPDPKPGACPAARSWSW